MCLFLLFVVVATHPDSGCSDDSHWPVSVHLQVHDLCPGGVSAGHDGLGHHRSSLDHSPTLPAEGGARWAWHWDKRGGVVVGKYCTCYYLSWLQYVRPILKF